MRKLSMLLSFISLLAFGSCLSVITSGYIAESDTNKDGSLSFSEFLVQQKKKDHQVKEAKKLGLSIEEYSKQEFKRMDSNNDGLINKKEILNSFKNKETNKTR